MTVFFPYQKLPYGSVYFAVKTAPEDGEDEFEPKALVPAVVDIVDDLDPYLPVYDIYTMSDLVGDSLARQRVMMWLLNLFSAIALIVATVGLYGVLSFTVARRTREIGVRVALGARRGRVFREIFRRPLSQVLLGILAGSALIAVAATLAPNTDFSWADELEGGLTLVQVAMLVAYATFMLGVCLLACVVPTRRALAVEPTSALRAD